MWKEMRGPERPSRRVWQKGGGGLQQKQNKKPGVLRAMCVLCAMCAAVVLFALVLRWDIRRPRAFDASEWAEPAPPGLSLSLESELYDGYATFTGLAYIAGEHFEMMDNFVLLRHRQTGKYLRLATTMTAGEGDAYVDGLNMAYGRFYAFVALDALPAAPQEYEVCFAYGANNHRILLATGQGIGGAA